MTCRLLLYLLLGVGCFTCTPPPDPGLHLTRLTTEYSLDPLGLHTPRPRLG